MKNGMIQANIKRNVCMRTDKRMHWKKRGMRMANKKVDNTIWKANIIVYQTLGIIMVT